MESSQCSKERGFLSLYIDGIKGRNSCTNLEIVAIPMEDVSLIEVMWSLYECSLPRANNMEYTMKNLLYEKKIIKKRKKNIVDEKIISNNSMQTGL